jgi:hypothetical protein
MLIVSGTTRKDTSEARDSTKERKKVPMPIPNAFLIEIILFLFLATIFTPY